jgi:hypothetical protein
MSSDTIPMLKFELFGSDVSEWFGCAVTIEGV